MFTIRFQPCRRPMNCLAQLLKKFADIAVVLYELTSRYDDVS
jgi:hypothetical protein